MKHIAHRGNIHGPSKEENKPDYIRETLNSGYDVEVDVWYVNDGYFLGHDEPRYEVDEEFLLQDGLWLHSKNIDALGKLHKKTNTFFHNIDDAVLTSLGYIWIFPNKQITHFSDKCVIVIQNNSEYNIDQIKNCYAVCSDNIK